MHDTPYEHSNSSKDSVEIESRKTLQDLVIIVDDDAIDRELVRRTISEEVKESIRIVEFENGESLLESSLEAQPACILLDHRMPGLSGLGILEALKQKSHFEETSIILLTGQIDKELAFNAFRNGAYDYINKSELSKTRLSDALLRALDRAKLHRDRRIAKEKLEKTSAQLARINNSQERLISVMSHEIRSPLSGLIGLSELLDPEKFDEQERLYLGMIRKSSREVLNLVDRVLEHYSLGQESNTAPLSEFVVEDVFELVNSLAQAAMSAKGVTLEVEISSEAKQEFKTNVSALKQVLINLVANAVKFSESSSVVKLNAQLIQDKSKVNVREGAPNLKILKFQVTDSGIGIDPAQQEKLFEAFSPVSRLTKKTHGGAGLGLNIVKELIHAVNGKIEVESSLGNGTTFSVFVPVYSAS